LAILLLASAPTLAADTPPPAPPSKILGLIGEYDAGETTLYILEDGGQLVARRRGSAPCPLTEVAADSYTFGDVGPFARKPIAFRRDPAGRATAAIVGGESFPRRALDGEGGKTFRIKPVRAVEEIRKEVVGLAPPPETGKKPPELVDLLDVVPGVKLDVRYATSNNFLGTPLYTSARALMQRPAAEALAKVQAGLKAEGYGLLIHDAYRPWRVTKLFWEATPPAQHTFVADPAKGSKHNRGCAVDLTLCDLATGLPIEMVGGYDEFSDRSYPEYPGGTTRQRWHRDRLRRAMEAEGFTVNEAEWWHFDFRAWRDYPILDVPFEALPPR
jgi:D-alanyl-D-alanine dipeptidase